GVRVSAKEVSSALHKVVPAAKAFLTRRLDDRKWMYLYVDGTNFRVRRSTVEIEPTLVVLGVDETGRKSVISMVPRGSVRNFVELEFSGTSFRRSVTDECACPQNSTRAGSGAGKAGEEPRGPFWSSRNFSRDQEIPHGEIAGDRDGRTPRIRQR